MTDQAEFWNGPGANRWVTEQERMDRMLRSFGLAAMDAAQLKAGEHVLDVGCGCGGTTGTLAERVGPGGRVLGLDISAPMLGRARELYGKQANVSFRLGDASVEAFGAERFDVLYSRFGVMFFSDPIAAFTHLRSALKPGGRLAFICWETLGRNPWASVPMQAALGVVGPQEPEPPFAPGPWAFGDAERVRSVLSGAGFAGVALKPFETNISYGESSSLDETVDTIARLGPIARFLAMRPEPDVAAIRQAVRAAIPPYMDPAGGARLLARAWVVTATNP